jgi:hypothetical protein
MSEQKPYMSLTREAWQDIVDRERQLREALREVRALWPYDDDRKLTAILDRALGDTPNECQE